MHAFSVHERYATTQAKVAEFLHSMARAAWRLVAPWCAGLALLVNWTCLRSRGWCAGRRRTDRPHLRQRVNCIRSCGLAVACDECSANDATRFLTPAPCVGEENAELSPAAAYLRSLTFDISGRRRAQPFDCPLDGRVRRRPSATGLAVLEVQGLLAKD